MILKDLKDASAYLGISKRSCRRLIEQRVLPFYRVGRLIKIAVEDLEIYLKQNRVEAT